MTAVRKRPGRPPTGGSVQSTAIQQRRLRRTKGTLRSAIHEAGHVIVGAAFNHPLEYVTIVGPRPHCRNDSDWTLASYANDEVKQEQIVSSAAGLVAELIFTTGMWGSPIPPRGGIAPTPDAERFKRRPMPEGWVEYRISLERGDYSEDITKCLLPAGRLPGHPVTRIARACQKAAQILLRKRNRVALASLAEALVAHGRLNGAEVQAVIGGAK